MDKPSASPGDEIVATGRGCDPGAPVTLRILGRVVGTTVADAGGRFSSPLRLPQLEVGRYELEALCGPRLTTFIDIVVASRVDQGAAASVVMIMFVMTGVFYLTSQMGDRRRP